MGLTVREQLLPRIPSANFFNRVSIQQASEAWAAGYIASYSREGIVSKALELCRGCAKSAAVRRAVGTSALTALELTQLENVDAVIDIGGFAYGDSWGTEGAKRALAWAEYCHSAGKPIFFLPQAWGPFTNPDLADIVRKMLSISTGVFARDRQSLQYLEELRSGWSEPPVLAPDIVFGFNGAPPQVGRAILQNHGATLDGRPLVGIAPNMRVYDRSPGRGMTNVYVQLLLRVTRFCVEELNADVVLIPHERTDPKKAKADDQFLCSLVAAGLGRPDRCINLPTLPSPALSKSVAGHLDLLIGSRFHMLVLALSSCVPTMAISWAHKYRELLTLFGLQDFVIEHGALEDTAATDLVHLAWDQRSDNRQKIAPETAKLCRQVAEIFDKISARLTT